MEDMTTNDTQSSAPIMNPSKLLELPAELRVAIYEHALAEHFNLGIGGSYKTSRTAPLVFGGDAVKRATQPPLTQVSRQIREETLPLFYQLNRFVLAVHYRLARSEVERWLDGIASQPTIITNIWEITIKHRFGILDFKGTIDFDLKAFRILGPELWFNCIPPLIAREACSVIESARKAEPSDRHTIDTLRRLVEILGTDCGI